MKDEKDLYVNTLESERGLLNTNESIEDNKKIFSLNSKLKLKQENISSNNSSVLYSQNDIIDISEKTKHNQIKEKIINPYNSFDDDSDNESDKEKNNDSKSIKEKSNKILSNKLSLLENNVKTRNFNNTVNEMMKIKIDSNTIQEAENTNLASRKILRSKTNVFGVMNETQKTKEPYLRHQSGDFNIEAEMEKRRKERINMKWKRFRNLTLGLIKFRKLSRNIKLFGKTVEIFDEKNPEVFEERLKFLQTYNNSKEINDKVNQNNKNNLIEEKINMFKPDSLIIQVWTFYILILMFYTVIFMPFFIAFINDDNITILILDTIIDISFIVDIILNFNTCYYDEENNLVKDRSIISKNYLKSWFTIDVLTSIPLSIILDKTANLKTHSYIKLLKIIRLYRLIKLLRIAKLQKTLSNNDLLESFNRYLNIDWGMNELFSFLIKTILLSHIFACIWYIISQIYDDTNNWLKYFDLQDESIFRKYLFSLYYSFSTLFTVGFGDIHSVNDLERIITIFLMLFGVFFYSFTIGTLSSVLVDMDSKDNKLKYKLSILNDFTKDIQIDSELKEKIKKILIYNSEKHSFSWIEKQNMFHELPITLKNEVSYYFFR